MLLTSSPSGRRFGPAAFAMPEYYNSVDRYHADTSPPGGAPRPRRRQLSYSNNGALAGPARTHSSPRALTSPPRRPGSPRTNASRAGSPSSRRKAPGGRSPAASLQRRAAAARSPVRRASAAGSETRSSPPAGPLRTASRLLADGWLGPTSEQSTEIDAMLQKVERMRDMRARSAARGARAPRVSVSPDKAWPVVRGSPGRRTVHEVYGEHAATDHELQSQVAAVSLRLATASNADVGQFYHHAAAEPRPRPAPARAASPPRRADEDGGPRRAEGPLGQWVGGVPSAGGMWLPSPDGEGLGARRFASVLQKIARRQQLQKQIQPGDAAAAAPPQPAAVRLIPILPAGLDVSGGREDSPRTAADSDETDDDFETETEDETEPAEEDVSAAAVPRVTALRALVAESLAVAEADQDVPRRTKSREKPPPPAGQPSPRTHPGNGVGLQRAQSGPLVPQHVPEPEPEPEEHQGHVLPQGWTRKLSRGTGQVYYWNAQTGESQYTPPEAAADREVPVEERVLRFATAAESPRPETDAAPPRRAHLNTGTDGQLLKAAAESSAATAAAGEEVRISDPCSIGFYHDAILTYLPVRLTCCSG